VRDVGSGAGAVASTSDWGTHLSRHHTCPDITCLTSADPSLVQEFPRVSAA
jgi:hypothetical protein